MHTCRVARDGMGQLISASRTRSLSTGSLSTGSGAVSLLPDRAHAKNMALLFAVFARPHVLTRKKTLRAVRTGDRRVIVMSLTGYGL